jgi:alpha-D-ribose 1-methylphosphonate 5-triphosphate synthase subunit PhnG
MVLITAQHKQGSMTTTAPEPIGGRSEWMGVLARASADDIAGRLLELKPLPRYRLIRGPETGLVMVQGRAGGDGTPFNLGEMTVTRCTLCTEDGRVGHAYVAGRDARQAELAALVDAWLLDESARERVLVAVIDPLVAAQQEAASEVRRRAAATKVEFFTMTQMR